MGDSANSGTLPSPLAPDTSKVVLLQGNLDKFNGIIVDELSLPTDPNVFESALVASLANWKEEGRRGCWIKIPHTLSVLVPIALKFGFVYHHTQKEYCMLTTWLSSDTNKIPNYASHYIGVGGVVINDKNEILAVTERYLEVTLPGFFKLPGGAVDPGEDIPTAVVREIWEETGIKAEFQEILCFRQQTNFHFGLTDMYFVCKCKPLTSEINKDDGEIAECKWIDFEEYTQIQTKFPLLNEINDVVRRNLAGDMQGYKAKLVNNGFRPDPGTFYYL